MTKETKYCKCAFCDFKIEKVIQSLHHASDGTLRVFDMGWRALQHHCAKEHPNEPAVKELLFSDWESLFGYSIDDGQLPNLLFAREFDEDVFIEPAEEEEW